VLGSRPHDTDKQESGILISRESHVARDSPSRKQEAMMKREDKAVMIDVEGIYNPLLSVHCSVIYYFPLDISIHIGISDEEAQDGR
jgi:hypothetical protein